MAEPTDPTRAFLDETVPQHDEWEGREPEEGPARPRHVQYPAAPLAPLTPGERRSGIARNVLWGAANLAAFAAGAALADDGSQADTGGMDGSDGTDYGEIGSGL